MTQEQRKCTSDNIRYLWTAVSKLKQSSVSAAKILKYMVTEGEYMTAEANDVLQDSISDGILVPATNTPSEMHRMSKTIKENNMYRLPEINEIKSFAHDFYCFECHKPGVLQYCNNCPRSFHIGCKRKHPEIPNDPSMTVTSSYRASVEESQIDDDDSVSDYPRSNTIDLSDCIINSDIFEMEDKINIEKSCPSSGDIKPNMKNEKQDNDLDDVICVGQIRSPRRRKTISMAYKNESLIIDDEEESQNILCTCCRLLKKALIRDPANISADEVSYLLNFTYDRIASWISNDTFSPIPQSKSLPMPCNKNELNLFIKFCLKIPKTLQNIKMNLKNKKYKYLTEFLVDFLDIQHCIGVLYGIYSSEFEATKYQVSDCIYELSEIRQCRDCYRHSNEKISEDWFCKPCVPRHEIVYAKQARYPFWPAKVIKFKANKYDVRFFGGAHGRAILNAKCVKPIDTDIKQLKMSISLRKAMEELQTYQTYNLQPPGHFSYESERNTTIQINSNNINIATLSPVPKKNYKSLNSTNSTALEVWEQLNNVEHSQETGTKKRKTEGNIEQFNKKRLTNNLSSPNMTTKKREIISSNKKTPPTTIKKITKKSNFGKSYHEVVKNLGHEMDKAPSREIAHKIALDTIQAEINHWKLKVDNLSKEIVETKKNSWCAWCLKSSIYHCCWNNSYCSLDCQNRHWHSEHKLNCKRVRDT